MSQPVITLTSDFGLGPFVGLMKGVILGVCPRAQLVDLDHGLPPGDVMAGALVLEQALGVFPLGTVHLAVVDPGVGGQRRAIALEAAGMLWVGPDNGLFTAILRSDHRGLVYHITDSSLFREPVSATFHGRDIFAPVAARLADGHDLASLGPEITDPVLLDWPLPRQDVEALLGQVLAADRFGNLMTNLDRQRVEDFLGTSRAVISTGHLRVEGISAFYGQAPPNEAVAVFNSLERLELAINRGDLCEELGLTPKEVYGLEVRVERS